MMMTKIYITEDFFLFGQINKNNNREKIQLYIKYIKQVNFQVNPKQQSY